MKHIKRKWKNLPPKAAASIMHVAIDKTTLQTRKPDKDEVLSMIMENRNNVQTYRYDHKDEVFYIPEPEPNLIYFNNAQVNLKRLKESKIALLEACKAFENGVVMGHKVYQFMYSASTFAIFLFTALEATINNSIPANFTYTHKGKVLDLTGIQYLNFADKAKKVLPKATGLNFVKTNSPKYDRIPKLKHLRDTIVHAKKSDLKVIYGEIVKEALDFNYDLIIMDVRDFINFYHKDFVQHCDCGGDYQLR
ncbi:MAG: hypothetical protein JNJ75_03610 [Cyclobacteriaceae bacterium]|nr:hypothetical protein [Cyclobacteriaceae bacterium]